MRLLHIIATINPTSGGPVEGIVGQDRITRSDVRREIVSCDRPDDLWVRNSAITVHAMGARRPRSGLLGHYAYAPDLVPWLRGHAGDYDAVIVHGLWNYATQAASRVLRGGDAPYFVFTHGMMDPWFRRSHPLKHQAKRLSWALSEGPLLAGARAVMFTSEDEQRRARDQFHRQTYREEVIGYGASPPPAPTPTQTHAFRRAAPTLGARSYLLYLGRIHPKKGVDLLIEAFAAEAAHQPELQLVIAGPDQIGWVGRLRAMAMRAGIGDRIHWPGMLTGDAKWGAYHGADAFILPSHQENFGIAVAEAMGCGKPALITDKVNIWREIAGGGAGLIDADTLAGVRSLLRRWFDLTPHERAVMGEAARRVFDRHFDVENTAPALIRTIEAMI